MGLQLAQPSYLADGALTFTHDFCVLWHQGALDFHNAHWKCVEYLALKKAKGTRYKHVYAGLHIAVFSGPCSVLGYCGIGTQISR